MPQAIDALTEAVVDVPPEVAYREILKLYAGTSEWHFPNIRKRHRDDTPFECDGALYDVWVQARPPLTIHCIDKLVKKVDGRLLDFDETGDFRGSSTWIFEPSGDGGTTIKFRWLARPRRGLYVLLFTLFGSSIVEGIERSHKEMALHGFKLLEEHVKKQKGRSP